MKTQKMKKILGMTLMITLAVTGIVSAFSASVVDKQAFFLSNGSIGSDMNAIENHGNWSYPPDNDNGSYPPENYTWNHGNESYPPGNETGQFINESITKEELATGWYYGFLDQKLLGTPDTWIHRWEGSKSAMWFDPNHNSYPN